MLVEGIGISRKNGHHSADPEVAAAKETLQPQGNREAEPRNPDLAEMMEVTADIQGSIDMLTNVNLKFSIHESSGEVMVTVTDEASGEVIREVPPSEILNLAAKLDEMIGLLFDQRI
jgi:flagellar protein FlaG